MPAWCPIETTPPSVSGKLRVAYASQDNLWLWDEGRSTQQLTTSGDIQRISVSDDGQIIAFTRKLDENHQELWAINADGSNERRLVSVREFSTLDGSTDALGVLPANLQWEPGTHHLTFDTYPIYHALWVYEPMIFWQVDVDTGKISPAPYSGGYTAYSPDGKKVVIYNMIGLSLMHVDGTNLREDILDPYQGIALGESYYDPSPYWASDSSSLLVALPDQEDIFDNNTTTTVWRVLVEGTPEKLGTWRAFSPSVWFSPDQTYMAYWFNGNQRELHLAQISRQTVNNTLDAVYIRGEMIDILTWSPDSRHFIFQMGNPGNQSQFFYIGDICQRPVKLPLNVGGDFTWVSGGGIAAWVDASRFLIEVGLLDTDDQWELHLGKYDQAQTDVLGVVTAYDWAILP